MEEILIFILTILLVSVLLLIIFEKFKKQFYKPISTKLLGRSIKDYIINYKSMGKYDLLAITSNTCSVCHTYLSQVQEAISKENIDISVSELQFNSSKTDKSPNILHRIYYGDAKLRKKMKINQYPLYLFLDNKGGIRQIFITETMALNFLQTHITEQKNIKTVIENF